MLADCVQVVLDVQDTPACARWFTRRHDPDRGRITVRVTPPPTQRSVPRDVLRGLGKRLSRPESPRQNDDAWPLAETWLRAEQVRDLFVLRAHLLDEETLLRLLATCDAARTETWLILAGAQPPPGLIELLDHVLYDADDVGIHSRIRTFEQTAAQEGRPPARGADAHPGRWPQLPDDEFWTFRSTSDELLSDADFQRVDLELFTGRMIALEWIERLTRENYSRRRRLKAEEIHGLLAGIHASATSPPQALARLRGAQAALFFAGVLVRIPADCVGAASSNQPAPLDRHATALLREFTGTRLAAAGALALATREPTDRLCALNLDDLSNDAAQITVARRAYPIPFYARGLVRAHRLTRERERATKAHPLFRSPRHPTERISIGALSGALLRVARATGLALDVGVERNRATTSRWPLEDCVGIELFEIAHRRLELGLSRTDLAHRTGLSWSVIARIEDHGEPAAFTLDAARRLAAALALDLTAIASPGHRAANPDNTRLEALLAHADQPLTLTEMARAMRWTLERTHRALHVLATRLAATGQTLLHAAPGRHTLAARGDILDPTELARLRRTTQPLTGADASLLHRLIDARSQDRRLEDFDADQRAGLARLAQHGLLDTMGTWVALTFNADYNLQPDLDRSNRGAVTWPSRAARAD